ncbi:MAG: hypothetical protein ACT4OV_11595 [Microthrixaceae bacterium]
MYRAHLDVIDGYEVVGQPVVGPTGLTYLSWLEQALEPYTATRLPVGAVAGLQAALRRAELAR